VKFFLVGALILIFPIAMNLEMEAVDYEEILCVACKIGILGTTA
jgi:hypothetical protein